MKNPDFFLHGTSNSKDVESIKQNGFSSRIESGSYKVGRATFSTNLIKAFEFASQDKDVSSGAGFDGNGSIIVFKKGDGFTIAPTHLQKIQINNDSKRITGNSKHWSEGRNHLAVYPDNLNSDDEVPNGEVLINRDQIELVIPPTPELDSFVSDLKTEIERCEFSKIETLIDKLLPLVNNDEKLAYFIVNESIKSEVLHLIRCWELMLKEIQGYSISKFESSKKLFTHKSFLMYRSSFDAYKTAFNENRAMTRIDSLDRLLIGFFTKEIEESVN